MVKTRTQIGIIGVIHSELLPGQMLFNCGIDAVILENRVPWCARAQLRAGI